MGGIPEYVNLSPYLLWLYREVRVTGYVQYRCLHVSYRYMRSIAPLSLSKKLGDWNLVKIHHSTDQPVMMS